MKELVAFSHFHDRQQNALERQRNAKEKVTEPQGIKSISSMMPIFC